MAGTWLVLRAVRTVDYRTHYPRSLPVTANARLDLRLSVKDRQRIDRAAALAGLPLATFVRTAVLREADRTVAAESVATLSPAESKRFLATLEKPFAPNVALRRVLKRGDALGL
jgi:uncharacterized protein (DUF1778 family)